MSRDLNILKESAPHLVTLSQQAEEILAQHHMTGHEARVALALDISGTMRNYYRNGTIQKFAEEVLALSAQFDDDSTIDVFLFGEDAHFAGEMRPANFKDFINEAQKNYISVGGTYYGRVIKKIRQYYFPSEGEGVRNEPLHDNVPVYVMIISDGTTADEEETIEQLTWASFEPMFWQFMSIGANAKSFGNGFLSWLNKPFTQDNSFLRKIDNMENRYVDNVGFFNVADPAKEKSETLFNLLLKEYPDWLRLAKEHGLTS